jgi:hypothetical protein
MLPQHRAAPPITIPDTQPISHIPTHVGARTSFLDTAAFSPVNENGCFEFDRIVKAGELLKRGRLTQVCISLTFYT